MKILIILVATAVVASGLTAYIALKFSGAEAQEQVTAVRLETVGRGDLAEVVSAPGQVQPKTKVQISAKVMARIMELPFDEGDSVTKGNPQSQPANSGSVLVKLDSTELAAQLSATEARYKAQTAQLGVARARVMAQEAQVAAAAVMLADAGRDLRRQKQLFETQDVSQSVVDQAQAKFDQLDAQLKAARSSLEAERTNLEVLGHELTAAEAEISKAKDNLSYTTITSPIDGVVTRVNAKAGEMVVTGTMNNPGTVIMEVADLSQMQVDAQIDESNVAAVREGQKAKVRIGAYPDDVFDGVVKVVGLDISQERGMGGNSSSSSGKWYKARIVLDTRGKRIPAGLSADVDIDTDIHKGAIKVPTQAVLGRPVDDLPQTIKERPEVDKDKTVATVVYRFDDGKALVTPVKIGPSDMTHTIILSGLSEGQRIIVGPYKVLATLKHEQKVKDEKAATQPTTVTTTQSSK